MTVGNDIVVTADSSIQLQGSPSATINNVVWGDLSIGAHDLQFIGPTNYIHQFGDVFLSGHALFRANANAEFTGVVAGASGFSITQSGTITLSGSSANTYTGTTLIEAGTLALNKTAGVVAVSGNLQIGDTDSADETLLLQANQQINNKAAVLIGRGGIFNLNGFNETIGSLGNFHSSVAASNYQVITGGGTLTTGGFSDVLNTLSLTADSTLDFGAGSSVIDFAGGVNSFSSGQQLTITEWSGNADGNGSDQLIFGTTLSAAEIGQIKFFNPAGFDPGTYNAQQLASGEIVPITPIPEPSTIGLLVLLAGSASYLEYRQRKRRCQDATHRSGTETKRT